jgi:hypothetical protein
VVYEQGGRYYQLDDHRVYNYGRKHDDQRNHY